MKSGLRAGALTTLAIALTAVPAAAINTYNAQPAPERTEVGELLVLWDQNQDGVAERLSFSCSGAMVDLDTYLTAAHCTTDWSPDPADDRYFVSLEQDTEILREASGLNRLTQGPAMAQWFVDHGYAVEGDPHYDAAFPGNASNSHDIAVIDFADRAESPADVWSFTPATLPTEEQLSKLGSRRLDALPWLVVGYGTQEATREPGGHVHFGGDTRLKAQLGFNSLNASWIRLSMVEAQGWGGACYGDSGGPNFVTVDGQMILAGTTITGDTPCYATNVAYRTDTESARSFLDPYVALPVG
jgi:hypothetical protein